MQVTAKNTGTRNKAPATAEETRPVRRLVPTVRREEYFLPIEDTLRASDLGVTRTSSDAKIARLVRPAAEMLTAAGLNEDPYDFLERVRDALRIPRDVQEAAAWGYHIPNYLPAEDLMLADRLDVTEESTDADLDQLVDEVQSVLFDDTEDALTLLHRIRDTRRNAAGENAQEIDPDAKKRLGWYWVYDLTLQETQAERRAHYLADDRLVDMRGFAAAIVRKYTTVKDLKHEGDNARKVVEDTAFRRSLARTYVENGAARNVAEAEKKLLAEARQDLLKALRPRRLRAGQSDMWYLRDAFSDGRERSRLDEWYEFHPIKQTGRPKGSRTLNRRPKVTTE